MSYINDDSEILNNIPVQFDYESIEAIVAPRDDRAVAKLFLGKLEEIIYILLKKEQGGRAIRRTAIWALAFTLGSKHLEGKSMTEVAEYLGVTRAAISKQAVEFSKMLNLPASPYMAPERVSPGKETELQKCVRLTESVSKADHSYMIALVRDLIVTNKSMFIKKGKTRNNSWGIIYDSSNVFVLCSDLQRLFNHEAKTGDILKGLRRAGVIDEGPATLRWFNSSMRRGYHLSIHNNTR